MTKRLLLALSVSALLLNGCAASTEGTGNTTSTAGPVETGTSAPSASPSASPSAPSAAPSTAPIETTPEPAPVEPAPAESEPAEPIVPSPAPAEVQPPPAPAEPAPNGAEWPSDTSPYPGSSPAVAFSAPVTPEWSIWIAGQPWKVTGSGYVPGEQLQILFGPANTDVFAAETYATVDANGLYAAWLDVPAQAAPGTYGILVSSVPFTEESKRYGTVELVAAY